MPSLSIIWLACRTDCHTCHNCDNPLYTRHTKPFARRGKDIRPSGTPPGHTPIGLLGGNVPHACHTMSRPHCHTCHNICHTWQASSHMPRLVTSHSSSPPSICHMSQVSHPLYRDVTLVTKTCSVFFVSQCDKIVIDWSIVISQDLSQVCHSVTSQCMTNHLSVPKSSQYTVNQAFIHLSHHLSQLCHKKERLWQAYRGPTKSWWVSTIQRWTNNNGKLHTCVVYNRVTSLLTRPLTQLFTRSLTKLLFYYD